MSDVISSELLTRLDQCSDACGYSGNSWRGYALLLRFYEQAIQRIPAPAILEAWDEDAVDRVFMAELEHLAGVVAAIFPGEGVEELASYLKMSGSSPGNEG